MHGGADHRATAWVLPDEGVVRLFTSHCDTYACTWKTTPAMQAAARGANHSGLEGLRTDTPLLVPASLVAQALLRSASR